MSDRLEWFPCYPSKLLGALSGMPPSQGYVYWVVCLRIYEVGGPCKDSNEAIARRTGLNKRVVSEALDALFESGKLVRTQSGIVNPFAEAVMADSRSLLEKRKTAGREGGLRSAKNRKEKQLEEPSKASAEPQQPSTHLQEQDSLFPIGKRASGKPMTQAEIDRKAVFDRGKEVLGEGAGGLIQKLLAAKHGNVALARAAIEQASTMDNPREYIGGILRGGSNGKAQNAGGYSTAAARLRHSVGHDLAVEDPPAGEEQPHRR